jgi:CubicO group peptidase (beta-lactamase class C family)
MGQQLSRRDLLALAATSTFAGVTATALGHGADGASKRDGTIPKSLDHFVTDYLRTMNAPGLALGLATRKGPVAAETYGYVDLAAKSPALPTHLFQIGSISKSFAALIVLQMQDEGKLDVQDSILRYLPWLPVALDYGDITVHQLLTHTSGMPNQGPLFPAEIGARLRQGAPPGTFHYSNWGYGVLGRLIEVLDNCTWAESVTRRIFAPLGMRASAATIDSSSRERIAPSYQPRHDDRPYPRHGALVPAANLTFFSASGSIAATAADMNRYMQMLLNRGASPAGRIISEKSFELFATGHVEAVKVGPGVRYGYGILVDELDGHRCLRHTGGMPSFMSSMQLDIDAGVGAFASINALQDYRPNAVVVCALRLLRSEGERSATVPVPALDEWPVIANADDYAGTYSSPDGRQLAVKAEDKQLALWVNGNQVPLQHRGADEFIADHPAFARFSVQFGRERGTVVELSHGSDWYAHTRFEGERVSKVVPELTPYVGYYQPDDDSLLSPLRVVQRRGRLWLDGKTPLESLGAQRFRLANELGNTEVVEFRSVVDGRAELLIWSSQVLRRVALE